MTNNTYQVSSSINRRTFLGACAAAGVGTMFAMAGCVAGQGAPAEEEASAADGQAESAAAPEASAPEPKAPTLDSIRQDVTQLGKDAAALLPPADPDPDNPFGIDKNINMTTIDQYLNLPGVAYRDARMLMDPARYEEIGGHANMDMTLEGFKVVPFPYVGTLQPLPVSNAYTGNCLFTVEWGEDGAVQHAAPNYEQSRQILDDLFPKDCPLLIMCGAGGYAGMTRQLLIYLGWDAERVYNVGGQWDYTGNFPVQLIAYDENDRATYMFWRADYAEIDFDALTPVA